ncbi:hypothetical protein TNCV_4041231 [Trichonephila clavipes]|nr:hypothetical protein TNCV_4041231 [Trichonephila clavipes]
MNKKILRQDSIYDSEQYHMHNEEKNIVNTCRGQKRISLFSSSKDKCKEKENNQNIGTLIDGSVWQKVQEDSEPERSSFRTIFREVSVASILYTKCNIGKGKVRSAFS